MSLHSYFLNPQWWPILFLCPLSWILLTRWDRRQFRRLRQTVGPRVSQLIEGFDPTLGRDRRRCTALAVFFAGLALMRPTWGDSSLKYDRQGSNLVVCLDVSRSMLARDVVPNRLEAAKSDIRQLVNSLRDEGVGLVVFAGDARLISPLTHDHDAILELLSTTDFLSVPMGGTNLGKAVEVAAGALSGHEDENCAIFLLSDGEAQDHGENSRTNGTATEPVYAVGYGTAFGAKIPIETDNGEIFLTDPKGDDVVTRLHAQSLRECAEKSGGRYIMSSESESPLQGLLTKFVVPQGQKLMSEKMDAGRQNYFQWPLFACFVLLVFEIGLGERRAK